MHRRSQVEFTILVGGIANGEEELGPPRFNKYFKVVRGNGRFGTDSGRTRGGSRLDIKTLDP